MKKLEAMKAVYCYFFPEVRQIVHDTESGIDNTIFNVTTPASNVSRNLESILKKSLDVPSTPEGYVNVDAIHIPIIRRLVEAYSPVVHGLKEFKHSYPTSGSSEGLFHLLAKLKADGVKAINVLNGEYEGYGIQAENLGMKVNVIDPETESIDNLVPGYWFVSNPSARDGNVLPNDFISHLCDLGNKVIVDLAYVGSTSQRKFDISNKNIPAVVLSLSKPFGLFRYRIGFTFSREEVPSLIGNKWFKDTIRLLQGLKVVEEFGMAGLYNRYRQTQESIVAGINKEFGIGMRTSDVLLLGHLEKDDAAKLSQEQLSIITDFKRGDGYRFCLTPYFEKLEGGTLKWQPLL
ncbi:MAG: aminotransferase class I/II-fold pyridoxal phosphate-dependent enzyme [Candidatus Woesearchaeota archaeon]